jgi:hypothetical protein
MSGGGPISPDQGFLPPAYANPAARVGDILRGGGTIATELVLDVALQHWFMGNGSLAGGLPVGAWPGAYSPGMQFEVTGSILSSAPTTPVVIFPASLIPAGKAVYINYILVTVNGATAWTTGYNVLIEDTAGTPVVGVTLATAQLTANAVINSLSQSGVTAGAAILGQSGLTASQGLQVVGSSASIVAGSPLIVTVGGFVK